MIRCAWNDNWTFAKVRDVQKKILIPHDAM